MRYTFNMVTMMKEKVNTHFSFPRQLNMAPYTEEYLMGEKKDQGMKVFETKNTHAPVKSMGKKLR